MTSLRPLLLSHVDLRKDRIVVSWKSSLGSGILGYGLAVAEVWLDDSQTP